MRRLAEIAVEVRKDWHPINNGAAVSALEAMAKMGLVTEPFGFDRNGYGVIGLFLSNATGWRGPVARRIKSELRAMCAR
jgi:hypothetical protein